MTAYFPCYRPENREERKRKGGERKGKEKRKKKERKERNFICKKIPFAIPNRRPLPCGNGAGFTHLKAQSSSSVIESMVSAPVCALAAAEPAIRWEVRRLRLED